LSDPLAHDVAAIGRIDVVPKILEVLCRTTGLGFSAVARVTEDRWVACAVRDEIAFGLKPGGELVVETTICNEIRGSGRAVVIDHVAEDEAFRDHHTPRMYGFQSYISVPIRRNGAWFGTLCAIDPRPARLSEPQTLATFELFAELIGSHLENQDRLAQSEAALLDAQESAELREQFIAVLGHDLRNPLASIDAGARLMLKTPLDERARSLLGMVQSSVQRMAGLINDVLDLTRGRLGGGFQIEPTVGPLKENLEHVVHELQAAHPDRLIEASFELWAPISCDQDRICQLLSNLLANALVHGDSRAPVQVIARTTASAFELAVVNQGEPIPEAVQKRLFRPFSRASVRPNQEGLGLGLYIASEIARAHGAVVEVKSDSTDTRFTLRMPIEAAAELQHLDPPVPA
jgi:signal transduction histidine kinase